MLVLRTFAAPAFGQTSESASSYTFSTIDAPLPNGQLGFTSLADINEEGQITGGFTDSNLGPYGFLLNFKKKVHSTEIRCSAKDVVVTEPQSINTHGEIAGFASVIVERIKIPQPPFKILITKISGFFRHRTGKCTILDFPGANLTEAVGVNDDGQVVGDYRDANGIFHGFFWDAGQFLTLDVPFPEARVTAPSGINNVGQIVGFYFDNNVTDSFPNGQAHGFLYDNGRFTSFDFPDAVATFPVDLNDNGQIVGIFAADNDSIGSSFLLDAGRFATFDVPFSGVVATQVSGINNRGQIVGRYIESNPDDPVNPFLSHGFAATPDVNALLAKISTTHTR
jgi:probable HAF family extracellular repeat protein